MAIVDRDVKNDVHNKVEMTINLNEVFGDNINDSEAARQAFGNALIEKIVEKAENFPGKYSDAYADSLDFKAFGKSQSDVNLTQTGSMLSALDILKIESDSIKIGWEPSSDEVLKAHGNITGKAGQVPSMKRDFFRLTGSEVKEIASQFEDDFKPTEQNEDREIDLQSIVDAINNQTLPIVGFDDES